MLRNWLIGSCTLCLVPLIFIVNFLFTIIPLEKIQGLPIFFPIVFCPIGLFFALKAHKIQKSAGTSYAFSVNLALFLFTYIMFGTLIFGP